jgi:uncharacterized protein (TIGR02996 family)
MTDDDWLAAIAAAPDDPLVRLAYADWLDDRGDPRGELLRLDAELAGGPDGEPAAEPLRARLVELVPAADARWRAASCRVPIETGVPADPARRFPLNAAGPWYTCGDCMACGAPEAEAADLLAALGPENSRTYFTRQPVTRAEVERACDAARICCVEDVRYGGTDPVVIQMLGNDPLYCDHLIQDDSPTVQPAPPPQPPEAFDLPLPPVVATPPPPERQPPWGLIGLGLVTAARLIYSAVRQDR